VSSRLFSLVRASLLASLWVAGLGLGGCAGPPPEQAAAAPDEVAISVLLTTDFHGHLAAAESSLPDGRILRRGGSALLGSYVANLRRAQPDGVLLLDAGDTLTGSLEANRSRGEPVLRAYELLGYAAMALGNHDLDLGQEVLRERIQQASFPVLAANVRDDAGQLPAWLRSGVLIERKGLRIGILGLATPETPSTTMVSNTKGLRFEDPVPAATAEARRLRAAGAQLVIALLHDGGACSGAGAVDDLEGCDLAAPVFRLARSLPAGLVDLVAGGHTHSYVAKLVDGRPVVVAGSQGQVFGRVDFVVSRAKGVISAKTKLHPLQSVCEQVFEGTGECDPRRAQGALVPATYAGAPVLPDPAVSKALAPVLAATEALRARPLGLRALRPVTRDYGGESPLGNLICDALLAAEPEAQVALMNSGGIRADLPAGPLTFGLLHAVMPFGNHLARFELSGAELRELLAANLRGGHGRLQVGGLQVSAANATPGAGDLRLQLRDGRVVADGDRVAVVANDYLALGGGGFGALAPRLQERGLDIRPTLVLDAVVAYLEEMGRQGRDLNDEGSPLADPARPRIALPSTGAQPR